MGGGRVRSRYSNEVVGINSQYYNEMVKRRKYLVRHKKASWYVPYRKGVKAAIKAAGL